MPTRMYIEKDGLEAGTPQGASELKAMLDAAKTLAMLGLQSDRYQDDPDFRNAVDDVLGIVNR